MEGSPRKMQTEVLPTFNEFMEEHPELQELEVQQSEVALKAPFYLGRALVSRFASPRPERWATPEQTLTTGGWKYDGDKED
jgi:hypothetical protein